MIAASFAFLIYIAIAGFSFWLAWQFVQAFVSIARSVEDIAATYRRNCASPPSSGQTGERQSWQGIIFCFDRQATSAYPICALRSFRYCRVSLTIGCTEGLLLLRYGF